MEENNQISLSLLTFLRYEYLNYCIDKSSESVSDEKNLQLEKHFKKLSISGLQVYKDSLIRELSMSTLEESGFYLGIRLVERLSVFRHRVYDQKEIIKFICKDLWNLIFLKQADRLKTNRRGGYAILDNELMWLSKLPSSINANSRKVQFEPAINVIIVCGIIRGALQHLGLTCSVAAEVSKIPSYRIKSSSITPLRQPFETFVTGSDETYKSVDRWRSKYYSSNDDYLSPSFLDDTCSLSSSPIFHDETPNTIIGTPVASPCNKSNTRKVRASIDSVHTNSNENTPTNNLIYKRSASISTPILTPQIAKTAAHDKEGFLIPDLPGTSRRRSYRSNRRNDISESYNNYLQTDSVYITMPPRLGLPSQTPLNMKDQYRKSPLPVVTANLDYRTVYMGDKLATRAKDLRRDYGASFREASPLYHDNYEYDHSYLDPKIYEDDLILHHGEILRNKYSKLYKARASSNYLSIDHRSRSLSSYYSESTSKKTFSPGYRSNSVYNNHRHSILGSLKWNNKRRRLGSYIANQNDILQQHIQIIDKSLDKSSNSDFVPFEGEMLDSPDSNKNCTQDSSSPIKSKFINSREHKLDFENRSIKAVSSTGNEVTSSIMNSSRTRNSETIDHSVDDMKNLEEPSNLGKLIFERFNSNGPDDSAQPTDQNAPFNLVFDSSQMNEYVESDNQGPSVEMDSASRMRLSSAISNSSLDEIVPRPLPNSSEISNRDINEVPPEIDSFVSNDGHFNDEKSDKSKNLKGKRIRANNQKKHTRGKTVNRRRHIDYHIPIDQVKPLPGIATKPLSDDAQNFDNSSRRYPKRLRTAPLKWYLGERLEYHRDEKNELGYTIAAIHKVANPKMLPNERGSIHPNGDISTNKVPHKANSIDERGVQKTNSRDVCSTKSRLRTENSNISKKVKSKVKCVSGNNRENKSNAVILRDYETSEEFSMISVFERNTLCWADVEYTAGKPYSVALSFISSQATCCEICLPPLTEKGLDESQDNYILGHVYMAPDSKSLQIMISDNNVYNIGIGDWFLIPDNTNYNFSNISDHSEVYISLYVIKDS
ncbi:Trafficking particle complex subunit 6B [Cryptosporidium sp. chipmunk genotype I]|uniref:Trafficking particle complex subunit 6B n=1 Tax=Cryptosporidium sp. chipmunk genotype I TaxID=1280935 RepID=UPI00351A3515|nr:Trafficking particle complex subunit 6B [Cryptosporidium sp. chipmunk genotype I]